MLFHYDHFLCFHSGLSAAVACDHSVDVGARRDIAVLETNAEYAGLFCSVHQGGDLAGERVHLAGGPDLREAGTSR